MKKIAIVFGTRPQVIKLAPLCVELDKHKEELEYFLVNTGQHYSAQMHIDLMNELAVPLVKYNFQVNPAWNPAVRIASMVLGIHQIFTDNERPDLVVVIGDTDSTLAGALAANKMGIPVAHVEAFLRSGNPRQPEEINRIMVDALSEIHFSPMTSGPFTFGMPKSLNDGCDLLLDAFMMFRPKCRAPYELPGIFNLLTLHRANVDRDFIQQVLIAIEFIGVQTVWPMHPRLDLILKEFHIPSNLTLIEPVTYLESLWLVTGCQTVLTDSGGLVREALWAGKPCVTLRTECEWPAIRLQSYTREEIVRQYHFANLEQSLDYMSKQSIKSHGDGKAAEKIVKHLLSVL